MAEQRNQNEPIRQSVVVDCPIEDAFELFTAQLSEWWPLASHSLSSDRAESCVMEPWPGGRVYERTHAGEERDWGWVTRWDPPDGISFAWHPDGDFTGEVDIDFCVEADGTRVTLIHTGWERAGVEACALASFAHFVCEQMVAA